MKTFKTPNGLELPLLDLKGKDYLQVAYRIAWFRSEHVDWAIVTSLLHNGEDYALCKAEIKNADGKVMATAHKREDKKHFQDAIEKAETGSIGRALALCGYGTQFAPEILEGDDVVDSPLSKSPAKDAVAAAPIPQAPPSWAGEAWEAPLETGDASFNFPPSGNSAPARKISEKQAKRLFAISRPKQWTPGHLKELIGIYGYKKSEEIDSSVYEQICGWVENFYPEDGINECLKFHGKR